MYVTLYFFTFALLQLLSDSQYVSQHTEFRKGLLLTVQASGDQYFVKFHCS
jgi:hypothetical protein